MTLIPIKCGFRSVFNLNPIFQTNLSCSLCQKPSFPVDTVQPFCHQFGGVPASLCAAEAQPVAAQNAFVRICTQKFLHQRGEARLLRLFPHFHLQGFIDFWQQIAPFPVGQKTVVTHYLKMLRRDMTDIAPDHLFLGQRLLPQASMLSMQRRVQGLTLSPFEPRYLFQPSSTVKRSFAGRGIYIRGFSVPEGCHRRTHRPSFWCVYPTGRRKPAGYRLPWRG